MTIEYSLDTSMLIGAWRRRLPPDVVPSFWTRFESLISTGSVRCIDEVKRELEKQDDDLFRWVKARPELFVPMSSEIWAAAQEITARFPELTKPLSGRNAADRS